MFQNHFSIKLKVFSATWHGRHVSTVRHKSSSLWRLSSLLLGQRQTVMVHCCLHHTIFQGQAMMVHCCLHHTVCQGQAILVHCSLHYLQGTSHGGALLSPPHSLPGTSHNGTLLSPPLYLPGTSHDGCEDSRTVEMLPILVHLCSVVSPAFHDVIIFP